MVSVDGRGESSHVEGASAKNEIKGHSMLSAGKKFHSEMLTQPSIKIQTARQIFQGLEQIPYLKVVGITVEPIVFLLIFHENVSETRFKVNNIEISKQAGAGIRYIMMDNNCGN